VKVEHHKAEGRQIRGLHPLAYLMQHLGRRAKEEIALQRENVELLPVRAQDPPLLQWALDPALIGDTRVRLSDAADAAIIGHEQDDRHPHPHGYPREKAARGDDRQDHEY
jgi:hypothetical protein